MDISFLEKIVDHKQDEVRKARQKVTEPQLLAAIKTMGTRRSLVEAMRPSDPPKVNIIAEIKRASPSKGIFRADLDAGRLAADYEAAGAVAISVLTDQRFFKGSAEDLAAAKQASTLPVLRKDFLVSSYQVLESAAWGADAVLLIARILSTEQIREHLAICAEFDMDALVEVHSQVDLEKVVPTDATLIGINNRDLVTFETDIQRAIDMAQRLAPGRIPVVASGIGKPEDVRQNTDAGLNNFLVGESLVRADNMAQHMASLLAAGK